MIWFILAAAITGVACALSSSYERAGNTAGCLIGLGVVALFLNLFLSFTGEERVKESQCNLKLLDNNSYFAIVDDGDIAYQCDSDVVPRTVDTWNVKTGSGGPTASVYYGKKVDRFWSVFHFKSDSTRYYLYTPTVAK